MQPGNSPALCSCTQFEFVIVVYLWNSLPNGIRVAAFVIVVLHSALEAVVTMTGNSVLCSKNVLHWTQVLEFGPIAYSKSIQIGFLAP